MAIKSINLFILKANNTSTKIITTDFVHEARFLQLAQELRLRQIKNEPADLGLYTPKFKTIKNDEFIKEKLPVPNCVGSFHIITQFKNALDGLNKKDIYKLKFELNHQSRTVSIKENPKLEKTINKFIKQIPEFFYIFRPKTNEPDLAHHVLSTFNQLIQHPEFKKLSQRRQNILQYAALLHDTGKSINSEPMHAKISVRMLNKSLEKSGIPIEDSTLILKLIKHHHYSYNIKHGVKTYEDYTQIFNKKDFKLLKILTEADLLSKEISIKNLRRLAENKIIFSKQEEVFEKIVA